LRPFEARNAECGRNASPYVRNEQNDFDDVRAANDTINEYRQHGHTTKPTKQIGARVKPQNRRQRDISTELQRTFARA